MSVHQLDAAGRTPRRSSKRFTGRFGSRRVLDRRSRINNPIGQVGRVGITTHPAYPLRLSRPSAPPALPALSFPLSPLSASLADTYRVSYGPLTIHLR